METGQFVAALVGTIGTLAGVIAVLYKTVLSGKDALIAAKDAQIQDKARENVELKATNQALSSKVDIALDTLGDAVRLVEAGAKLPPRRGQGSGR